MWTLIILIYASNISGQPAVALTTINDFKSNEDCILAGKASKNLSTHNYQELTFVCVKK